jgi:hypothetical protein
LTDGSVQQPCRNDQTKRRTEEKGREPITFGILNADGSIEVVEARSMQSQAAGCGENTQHQEDVPQDSLRCTSRRCAPFPTSAITILHA